MGQFARIQLLRTDNHKEIFEVVNDKNEVVGTEARGECHKHGYKHRAVYCLVFNEEGKLLLQQRSSRKDIGPGQWDLSLAEHLQPGESYEKAVIRGLKEELGISARLEELQGPLSPCHERVLNIPGKVHDAEFVQTHRLDGVTTALKIDEDEVQAIRWNFLDEVYQAMELEPDSYTPWIRAEFHILRSYLYLNSRVLQLA